MTISSVTKSHVKISSDNVIFSKDRTNIQLHKKFTKRGDLYLEISTEFRSITITVVLCEYITYMSGVSTSVK